MRLARRMKSDKFPSWSTSSIDRDFFLACESEFPEAACNLHSRELTRCPN